MKYLFIILLILLGGLLYGPMLRNKTNTVRASEQSVISSNPVKEKEIQQIQNILKNTPAQAHAKDIWSASDYWRVDFRILLAIIRLESSNFQRVIPNCYNGTGYGIYGKKVTCFKSFRENIFTTAKHWATNKRFTKADGVVAKACMWNKGSTKPCEYGYKLAELIKNY